MIPSERLNNVQQASKLMGMTVRTDRTRPDVDNLLVDLSQAVSWPWCFLQVGSSAWVMSSAPCLKPPWFSSNRVNLGGEAGKS